MKKDDFEQDRDSLNNWLGLDTNNQNKLIEESWGLVQIPSGAVIVQGKRVSNDK